LLTQVPYKEIKHPTIFLPQREYHSDYMRAPVPEEIHIPQVY